MKKQNIGRVEKKWVRQPAVGQAEQRNTKVN